MARPIKNFLSSLIAPTSDWKLQLIQHWPNIIGDLNSHVTLEKVTDDTIILGVYDSCWMQELYMLSSMLLHKINTKLGHNHIKQIRFKSVSASKLTTKKTYKKTPSPQQPITLTPQQNIALDRIDDQELRSALKAFLIRCYREQT